MLGIVYQRVVVSCEKIRPAYDITSSLKGLLAKILLSYMKAKTKTIGEQPCEDSLHYITLHYIFAT